MTADDTDPQDGFGSAEHAVDTETTATDIPDPRAEGSVTDAPTPQANASDDALTSDDSGGHSNGHGAGRGKKAALIVGSLGVVFGDIGTSPLYAIKESFGTHGGHRLAVDNATVLGLLSLVFWSLILVICVKYLTFIMRADNHGEGGILALTALIRDRNSNSRQLKFLILAGLFGAALLYGDGMITPAISVLSAVEGTEVVTTGLTDWVIPIAIAILIGLFSVQRRGTASVGRAFGPIMMVWFSTLGVLGLVSIVQSPEILKAVNPVYIGTFFADHKLTAFLAMGAVFLVVTGGEALYADMGHFGRIPIRTAWYAIALPGLLLNYFGQGALLMREPEAVENPFFHLSPEWAVIPLVVLATLATVIASQALISGAFSLTKQAVSLGYLPRVRILQTSEEERGQIYVPAVNWVLLVACVGLVIGFRKSSNLAAAYGLAVTGTMAITTMLYFRYITHKQGWKLWKAAVLCGMFLTLDLAFLGANIPKIPAGGWFPLLIGLLMMIMLTTWFAGRALLAERINARSVSLDEFARNLIEAEGPRSPGVGVYLGANPDAVPQSLATHYKHAAVLPDHVIVVSVSFRNVPHVEESKRLQYEHFGDQLCRIVASLGFMDEVDVPAMLNGQASEDLGIDFSRATYVLGREAPKATKRPGMALWREKLFVLMMRNASTADQYFQLPPERTLELGVQVEL